MSGDFLLKLQELRLITRAFLQDMPWLYPQRSISVRWQIHTAPLSRRVAAMRVGPHFFQIFYLDPGRSPLLFKNQKKYATGIDFLR
jgi:hypothetical protein